MLRIFDEHRLRPVESLDGLWHLSTDAGAFEAYVPGVWERIPALTRYRGVGRYKRTVDVSQPGSLLLRFGGASHTAQVLWDGCQVGGHYNAFTGFDVLLEDVPAGAHALEMVVDNRFGEQSALHIPNDYYTYGGINRPVELHRVGDAYIERMAFHAVERDDGGFTAHVRAWVRAVKPLRGAEVHFELAGKKGSVALQALQPGVTACVEARLEVGEVRRWNLLDGQLYDLTAQLWMAGAPVDDLIDRVGFRTVALDGERILINGEPARLKGFNRHEDHGQFGCALSVDAMMDDLQLILETGANSVRTCHYPNDPRFLDLCDSLGIAVWEEHHARALPHEILASECFAEQERTCNVEMITQHVNHPCIYVWGVLNECESDTAFGRELYSDQLSQLRALDPTRPVTYASCRFFTDICMDLVDIASFNIYPQWYVDEDVASYLEKLLKWMDENGAGNKPIIISEVGAGGIAGFHDPMGMAKWSEERQSAILRSQLSAILQNPRVSGVYIWQFADTKVAEEWSMHRPKTMNNKGVVDTYRRPKQAYMTVRELFRDDSGSNGGSSK